MKLVRIIRELHLGGEVCWCRVPHSPPASRAAGRRRLPIAPLGRSSLGTPCVRRLNLFSAFGTFVDYVRERLAAFPDLTATRLLREIRERGFGGAYSPVKRFVAAIRRNEGPKPFTAHLPNPSS